MTVVGCDNGNGNGNGGDGGQGVPTITTTSLANGTVGTAYSRTLSATGSTPITWSIDTGSLPTGLNLSTAGVISGTPTTAATSNFTVKATNAIGSGTKALSIVIAPSGGGGSDVLDGTTWVESLNVEGLGTLDYVLTFNGPTNFTWKVTLNGEPSVDSGGTYTISGSAVTLNFADDNMPVVTATLSGNTLNINGLELTKQ